MSIAEILGMVYKHGQNFGQHEAEPGAMTICDAINEIEKIKSSLELGLVSTTDLIDQLKGRFDDLVFIAQKKETVKGRLDTWDFMGDYTNCLGLCSLMQFRINQDRDENSTSPHE